MSAALYIPQAKHMRLARRPRDFALDRGHRLAQGLVFAGLGRFPGTNQYSDSTCGYQGTLTAMDPLTDWMWDSFLQRWSLDFDNTDDQVVLPASVPDVESGNYWTVACWHRPLTRVEYGGVVQVGTGGIQQGYRVGSWAILRAAGGVAAAQYTSNIMGGLLEKWTHVAVVASGPQGGGGDTADPNSNIFINGVSNLSTFSSMKGFGANRTVGKAYTKTNGRIADVLVWNRVLSQAEIAALADPSNVMLSGLIVPARRRLWMVPAAAPPVGTLLPILMSAFRRHRN